MPIFKYICKDCNHGFERFVQATTVLDCPSCKGTTLEKQLSVVNVSNGARAFEPNFAPGSCGTCGDPRGPGSCSTN